MTSCFWHTWCAAEINAGSNAENVGAGWGNDDGAKRSYPDKDMEPGWRDNPLSVGTFTYGITLHGSKGVLVGGLWLFSIIPAKENSNY